MRRRRESEEERSCRERMQNFRKSDRYDGSSLYTDMKARVAVLIHFFVHQGASEECEGLEIYDQSVTDEPCSVVLNFLEFMNEFLRTASE